MKTILKLAFLFTISLCVTKADVLRLRDGSVLIGQFVAGSQNEIWFHREVQGTMVYPLSQVDSLAFGSSLRPSSYSIHEDFGRHSGAAIRLAGVGYPRRIDLRPAGEPRIRLVAQRLALEGRLPPNRPLRTIFRLEKT